MCHVNILQDYPGFRWIKNPAAISPVWLEKPERIAALAMLTVVGLLVYAVIQRQIRLYLRDHRQHIPGNKGPTATPTAAVVFALFAPVMLVQFVVDNTTSLQGHGVQDYHLIICEAVGIDPAWYHGVATEQNSASITASATLHPFSLAHCSSWRTEGRRGDLD